MSFSHFPALPVLSMTECEPSPGPGCLLSKAQGGHPSREGRRSLWKPVTPPLKLAGLEGCKRSVRMYCCISAVSNLVLTCWMKQELADVCECEQEPTQDFLAFGRKNRINF